ncbi:phenylalanine--tRNA ligase, chloroplastic/mitochondrial isoform X2 [Cryptomeria japonica]|uniref:phenylalanine--tRNA ligase, chloroplastic/mitochondrial isoform X2 n=1 Tax=Cryptomeria japonica TaxID=3369 RepID=UPI0025ABDF60|nr:phenylalanine--tRNA ligase, chloroplastic/mitochondrial isoform X2 [Cryptomeria japonica]
MASVGRQAPSIIHLTQCKSRAGFLFAPSISSVHLAFHSRKPPKLSLSASSTAIHTRSILGSFGFYRRFSAIPILSKKSYKRNTAILSALVEVGGVKITKDDVVRENDPTNNVPDSIFAKIGLQLHRRDNHPLGILKNEIYNFFDNNFTESFNKFDNLCPIVSVKANFDDVLVPPDHVSRSYNDTYYINTETVLRCHTSAHQAELLREGYSHFLVTGDVYRRDSIDATHYPVFHQMEGFRVFSPAEWEESGVDGTSYAAMDLKKNLEALARHLFGDVEMRWVDTYFPFTNPSFELEIYFQEKWMEVLGCGVTEQAILNANGRPGTTAWAFGLGLERLAMVLFDIPDIRLFWSSDHRFTSQFSKGQLGVKFKPFSKFPPCYKDISFWINEPFTENNLCEVVRGVAGDLAEEVSLIDEFTNKKGMTSHCYRITFRSMERSLTDEEVNRLQRFYMISIYGCLPD